MRRPISLLAFGLLVACQSKHQQPTEVDRTGNPGQYQTDYGRDYSDGAVALTMIGVQLHDSISAACGIPVARTFFSYDSDELAGQSVERLDQIADCLTSGPLRDRSIQLVGHADPRGTDAYNRRLGYSRADAVADYLRSHGVPAERILMVSQGERLAEETDPMGWPYDRRVDIQLVEETTASR